MRQVKVSSQMSSLWRNLEEVTSLVSKKATVRIWIISSVIWEGHGSEMVIVRGTGCVART